MQTSVLFDVAGNELGHFKHRNLGLAAENGFKSGIGVDEGLFLLILELVLLDVVPDFFGEFTTGNGCRSNDSGKDGVRLNGFQECGVSFAFWFGCSRHIELVFLKADTHLHPGGVNHVPRVEGFG